MRLDQFDAVTGTWTLEQDHVAVHLVEDILEEEGMGGEELLCCHNLETEKLYTGRRETRAQGMIRFKPVPRTTGLELEAQVDLYIVSTTLSNIWKAGCEDVC